MKLAGMVIAGSVLLLVLIGFLFIQFSPQFGANASKAQKEIYASSGHYRDGIFQNEVQTSMDMPFSKFMSVLKDYITGVPNSTPKSPLSVLKIDSLDIANHPDTLTRITWFGHSAFLVEMKGKNILIDPMFGSTPSPHPWLGRSRFTEGLPINIEQLPVIDMVIFSHDHYDHLDYGSIQKLKHKVKQFYSPLGVSGLVLW